MHEGTPADACYLLLEGEVRVLRDGVDLALLGPGDLLGEMALLGRSLRAASATTRTPVRALRLEYDVLRRLLHERPRLARSLSAVYQQHVTAARTGRPARACTPL